MRTAEGRRNGVVVTVSAGSEPFLRGGPPGGVPSGGGVTRAPTGVIVAEGESAVAFRRTVFTTNISRADPPS